MGPVVMGVGGCVVQRRRRGPAPIAHVAQRRTPSILSCMTSETVVLAVLGGLRRFVLSERRLTKGWTQAQLAQRIGRSQQWVSKLESRRVQPSLGDVLSVLHALDATVAVRPKEAAVRPNEEPVGARPVV